MTEGKRTLAIESRQHRIAVGGLLALGLTLGAPAMAQAANLTREVALERVTLVEDPLEKDAVLSTEKVHRSTQGFLKVGHNDHHLRAFVDRQSGETRFELRQTLQYAGTFREFQRVNYETAAGGPATAALTHLESNRPHCEVPDPPSACTEVVSFRLGEAELRRIAATDSASQWRLKFKPRHGGELRAAMPRAEIQALLGAVDDYRTRRGQGAALSGQP